MYPFEMIGDVKVYKVPISKIYQALKEERGHVDLIRGEWFTTGYDERNRSGVIVGACILGQGSINMGVLSEEYAPALNINFNVPRDADGTPLTLVSQLNRFRVDPSSKWWTGNGADLVGSTIINWNDKQSDKCIGKHTDLAGNPIKHGEIDWDSPIVDENDGYEDWSYISMQEELCEREYALPTYADVLAMAYDVLSPHFNETVRLVAYDYNV